MSLNPPSSLLPSASEVLHVFPVHRLLSCSISPLENTFAVMHVALGDDSPETCRFKASNAGQRTCYCSFFSWHFKMATVRGRSDHTLTTQQFVVLSVQTMLDSLQLDLDGSQPAWFKCHGNGVGRKGGWWMSRTLTLTLNTAEPTASATARSCLPAIARTWHRLCSLFLTSI